MKLLRLFTSIALLPLLAPAWCAAGEPGGQGTLDSNLTNACVKPNSGTVTEVCANYRIKWKMWTLMGEPVGDYTLAWQLTSITLMNPERRQVKIYSADSLPNELKKAAGAIALYIDGVATVNGQYLYHRFNTGVSVRAGAAGSYNTPGSTHWDEIFSRSGGALLCMNRAKPDTSFLNAQATKAMFAQGILLTDLHLCPGSTASELTALESAISRLCEKPKSDKAYLFCPKAAETPKEDASAKAIDDAFAKLEGRTATPPAKDQAPVKSAKTPGADIDAAFAQMEKDQQARQKAQARERARQERHDAIVASCRSQVEKQNQCLKQTCGTEPDATTCTQFEEDPLPKGERSCLSYRNNCSFPTSHCVATGANPKHAEWQQCLANQHRSSCFPGDRAQTIDSCVAEQERRQNR